MEGKGKGEGKQGEQTHRVVSHIMEIDGHEFFSACHRGTGMVFLLFLFSKF